MSPRVATTPLNPRSRAMLEHRLRERRVVLDDQDDPVARLDRVAVVVDLARGEQQLAASQVGRSRLGARAAVRGEPRSSRPSVSRRCLATRATSPAGRA